MAFLLKTDYFSKIRSEVLETIIDNNETALTDAENSTVIEVSGYLSTRYDVDLIFAPVLEWFKEIEFKKGDRIQLTTGGRTVWNNTDVFPDGDLILNVAQSKLYRSIDSPVAGTPVTDSDYFEFVGNIGDLYSAVIDVSANTSDIDDETYFKKGDTRNPLVVRNCVDVVLYEIHCLLNPNMIPEHRIQRRDDAIKYLKSVADPRNNNNPNLPLVVFEANHGVDISFGGREKTEHYY